MTLQSVRVRSLEESRTPARLRPSGRVPVHDAGIDNDRVYIGMPLIFFGW
jgi:hypothetical protein